jgi:hypothetical protein
VVLKLVTKVIANRLKPILPEIIDEEQSAFVQGRLITDNALIAMECFHWMKKKTKGKKGLMALKLDMAKAFDRIEWPFVQAMLSTMGFPETLIKTIMNCITSVSYQILINGQPSKCFSPERGLRQGDPLSPYLFILCANVLSGLLKKESQQSNIHGIQIARNAPKITHLLFADDSLLFARANPKEAETIMKVLQSYQLASGQMVNLDKSEVSFSRNVPEIEKDMICHQIAIKTVASHSRYLGLPVIFGRSKKDVFSFVQERIWKKVKGWKEKFLSRAGKETLIKSVAQAIPNYIMSCYKIPEGCCKSIESMLAKFWWGSEETSRKVHWLSWQRLGTAMERGGLGFRSFHDFNKALLGKQCWRLITDPNSLAARIFKCRYHPRKEFMAAKVGFQPSYAWRSLMHAKEVISSGARWAIGNGQKVQIYNDGWIPNLKNFKIQSSVGILGEEATVSELIDVNSKMWKRDLIYNNFNRYEATQILNIPISARLPEDKIIWHWEKDGQYSVRSAHHLLCNEKSAPLPESSRGNCRILWKRIWSIPIPKSAQNFLWRLARNIIPTRKNLSRKGISLDMCCPLCHNGSEDVDHLFMLCPASMAVWFASPLGIRIPSHLDFLAWMKHWLTVPDVFAQQLFCITLWMIWRHRNFTVFKNSEFVPIIIAKTAAVFTDEFNTAAKNPSVVQTSLLKPFWTPPKRGQIKVNVDADCFADGRTGWGMVARNAAGLVLCSATKIELLTASPLLAECLGLRWVIDWAVEQNFSSIVFETDAESVVKCMQGALKLVEIESIVLDCLEGLSKLSNPSVESISRVSNFVAHDLACLSKFVGSCNWMGCVPDQCFSSYCKDLSFIN